MSEACPICDAPQGAPHGDHGTMRVENGIVIVPSVKRPGKENRVPVDIFRVAKTCVECMTPRPGGRRPCATHQPLFDRYYREGSHRRKGL